MADIPNNSMVRAEGLRVHFHPRGFLFNKGTVIKAVDGVDLQVMPGEVLGLVGESGSGKSTLGRAVLRLVDATAGRVLFDGEDLTGMARHSLRRLRRRMQIVFQDPYNSLNPRMQVSEILSEPIRFHGIARGRDLENATSELMQKVGLDERFLRRYPHEFSGGQRQRIAIARALASKPDFIVADEPVSALDVSVQAQILNLLMKLQIEEGISMLFISHDIAVVERISDRIAVMSEGKIVETGSAAELLSSAEHKVTKQLIRSAVMAEDHLA